MLAAAESSLLFSSTAGLEQLSSLRVVAVRVTVINIGSIRVGDQSFECRFDLECTWAAKTKDEVRLRMIAQL